MEVTSYREVCMVSHFVCDFRESHSPEAQALDKLIISRAFGIPVSAVESASEADDRQGIDYWACLMEASSGAIIRALPGEIEIGVQMKSRGMDAERYMRRNGVQLAVEPESNCRLHKPGELFRPRVCASWYGYRFAHLPHTAYLVSGTQAWRAAHAGAFDFQKLYHVEQASVVYVPLLSMSAATGLVYAVEY